MGQFTIQVWRIWNQTKQTQAESHLLHYQRLAIDGIGELERDPETQSQAEPNHFNASNKVDSTALNTYKINYDGALSNADNKSGIGVVVQDGRGEVIASLVQQLDQAYQAMEIEAMAACKAMEFGSELGLQRVIVEGDLVLVVKALKCKDNGLAPYAHLINDVIFWFIFRIVILSHKEKW